MKVYLDSWHFRFLRHMDVLPPTSSCEYVLTVAWWLLAVVAVGWLAYPAYWIANRLCKPVEYETRR